MSEERLDRSATKIDWSENSAQEFALGKIPSARPIAEDRISTTHTCTETPILLPGNVAAIFRFDRRILRNPGSSEILRNQLFFLFNSQTDQKNKFADFFFTEDDQPYHFNLTHRYIAKELRGKGVGTLLLEKAEHWFQSVANVSERTVTITISIAQPSVMRWALKNNYTVTEKDSSILERILNKTGDFNLIKPLNGAEEEEFVFPKSTPDGASPRSIRLNFTKVLTPIN